jgi:hypothetical protein
MVIPPETNLKKITEIIYATDYNSGKIDARAIHRR